MSASSVCITFAYFRYLAAVSQKQHVLLYYTVGETVLCAFTHTKPIKDYFLEIAKLPVKDSLKILSALYFFSFIRMHIFKKIA
jgi:hypothetical protein